MESTYPHSFKREVCLILPALNEGPNLDWLLPKIVPNYRTIVVDNDSNDDTSKIAKKHGSELVFCKQRGYGNAVLAALKLISQERSVDRPKIIVICDADGTSPIESISNLIAPILSNQSDFVIGQRVHKDNGAMPIHANFGNWLTVTLIKLSTGYQFQEMGPLRAIRYDSLSALAMEDRTWGWNVEMQMKAVWQRLRILEIPISYSKRLFGHSKISGSLIGSIKAGAKILTRIGYFYIEYQIKRLRQMISLSSADSKCK